jgi:hypothetical protein
MAVTINMQGADLVLDRPRLARSRMLPAFPSRGSSFKDSLRGKTARKKCAEPTGGRMQALLTLSAGIDALSKKFGQLADYMVLFCALISAGNAIVRYLFSMSSNGWLEIQWYMFAVIVLMGASYTLKMNEHVRVDIFYGSISDRGRLRHHFQRPAAGHPVLHLHGRDPGEVRPGRGHAGLDGPAVRHNAAAAWPTR